MGDKHTKNDRVIGWEEIRAKQRDLTSHSKALSNIFKIGSSHGDKNAQRTWENYSAETCTIPDKYIMPNLHKDFENGLPKSRPVVGAATGMSTRGGRSSLTF